MIVINKSKMNTLGKQRFYIIKTESFAINAVRLLFFISITWLGFFEKLFSAKQKMYEILKPKIPQNTNHV